MTVLPDHGQVNGVQYPVSIAPMMDWTDRHYRYFMRRITRRTLLYTEMITSHAILRGDRDHLLGFHACEHPISLQIGGDNPVDMAECARIAQDYGYDEVNINVGCPSDRVQSGRFGACLMKRPADVAACVVAMQQAVSIPVTVKHRIGVDDLDRYEDMRTFVEIVSQAGARRFSVHARKAWLQGLSPKENRTVPPLRYTDVYRLKEEFPDLTIEINGGIKSREDIQEHLKYVDAVMIGRAAYSNPFLFVDADRQFYGEQQPHAPTRESVALEMMPYIDEWLAQGPKYRPFRVIRHMLNLFAGEPGTKAWKRQLTERCHQPGVSSEVIKEVLESVKAVKDRARSDTYLTDPLAP